MFILFLVFVAAAVLDDKGEEVENPSIVVASTHNNSAAVVATFTVFLFVFVYIVKFSLGMFSLD